MNQLLKIQSAERKWIMISLDPQLFPLDVVLFTAHELLTQLAIRIEGNPENQLQVRIAQRHTDIPLGDWELLFQQKLIEVSLKESRWHQKTDIREYLLAAAVSYDAGILDDVPQNLLKEKKDKLIEAIKYEVGVVNDRLELSIGIGKNEFALVRLRIFQVSNTLKQICYFFPIRLENGHILCSSYSKVGRDMSALKKRICQELDDLN
ncbi:MAG: hypothetical protein OXG97_04810 [Candidatus Poribacteria bacterium]|nr:hypothetical protein [Candidatus Poribacteria bacterium]